MVFAFWKSFTRWATRPGPWDPRASRWNAPVQFQDANFEAARSHAWPAMGPAYGVDLEDGGPPPRSWLSAPQGHGGNGADGLIAVQDEEDRLNAMVNTALLKYTNGVPLTRDEEVLLLSVRLPPVQNASPRTGVGQYVNDYDVPFTQATDHLGAVMNASNELVQRAQALQPPEQTIRVRNIRSAFVRRAQNGDW